MDTNIQQGIQGYYDLLERKIPVVVMEPVKGGKLADFNKDVAKDFKDYNDDSLAKWALRWVGSLEGVKVILSGMNEESQVIDNLNTFKNFKPLNPEELKLVENVAEKLKKVTKVGCTNCKYCLPCPQGVNIPRNFDLLNRTSLFNDIEGSKKSYDSMANENKAISCIKCGKCEKLCPQNIEIRAKLEDVVNTLPK